MNHEIYTALSGALANERRQEITANNLANVNSGGFRREVPLFSVVYDEVSRPDGPVRAGAAKVEHNCFVRHSRNWIDFQTGKMVDTGNPLDVALSGDGFFALKRAADGQVYYSRDGHFRVDQERRLTAMNGDLLLAAGEEDLPIELVSDNPGAAIDIKIGKSGDVLVGGQPLGVLRLVTFAEPQG
ncbi:MAG: flagellar hook basal-body protein, partial [Deltaproteobacteria bacterium]|nr:flagellar hook basal-body protein [Deltaproteobacteria bacterium]